MIIVARFGGIGRRIAMREDENLESLLAGTRHLLDRFKRRSDGNLEHFKGLIDSRLTTLKSEAKRLRETVKKWEGDSQVLKEAGSKLESSPSKSDAKRKLKGAKTVATTNSTRRKIQLLALDVLIAESQQILDQKAKPGVNSQVTGSGKYSWNQNAIDDYYLTRRQERDQLKSDTEEARQMQEARHRDQKYYSGVSSDSSASRDEEYLHGGEYDSRRADNEW